MDRDFQWIRKVIRSITHYGQISSAEKLIELYIKKYENSEDMNLYSLDFESSKRNLENLIIGKKTILEL